MFIRFVTQKPIAGSRAREGNFAAAYDLKRSGHLTSADEDYLTELLEWFKQNLPIPTWFNRTTSKGYYRRATTGIARFKPSAATHLEKIEEFVQLLDRYEVRCEIVKSKRPGYLIYEDDAQVVAEPFRDSST
ncbi:MAG TPA: hypothetical protein VHU23_01855 [Rhizomicrobium sp.]|jgi:hypothetical protein|nr:hypothetical protein [Rhizomicrobium sp.]